MLVSLETYKKHCVIVLFSCVLAACATSEETYESAGDPVRVRGNDCIFESTIRDYQVLDDRNLIVTAAGRRSYHVELSRRAYGLRSSWAIGFVSPTGSICSTSSIQVDDGFGRQEKIRLSSVRALSPEELDAMLVQYGKKATEVEQATEPEEMEGAEVEELD